MKKRFYYLFLPLIFLACHDEIDLVPISSWTRLNNFPGLARASATSFVMGEKAYICMGRSGTRGGFLKDVWEYDSRADSWTRKSDFPGKARVKAIGGVVGDKAYVGLGAVAPYEGNQFNDFWEYDISGDSWTQMASFPGEGKNDLFCAVVDSCIYTTEGYTTVSFVPDTYKYNTKTNVWSKLTDCPVYQGSTAGFSIGHSFYVGTGFRGQNYKNFYCYQTETDTWSRTADLPEARILSKGIAINGEGYIMLGRYWNGALNGGRLLSDIVKFNPENNNWTRCGNFPGGARQNMVVFTINGKGYILTGEDDKERKSDVWMFQP